LTFIDTPGHAAFLKQRERGAKITDIVVLVVAADDGVQEQTVEAIKHILEAGCSIVVALNKMDKERTINTERVKMQLLRHGIQVEDMGGDVPCVEVSGLTGYNIDLLLETILLQAEELDLRADVYATSSSLPYPIHQRMINAISFVLPHFSTGNAEGTVLDAHKREWRGFVSSIIVHHGTLKKGDAFVCGLASGVAKALTDVSTGKPIDDIRPGTYTSFAILIPS
jgi:translation initiation factor IF-2